MNGMNLVVIARGWPGCGKSHEVKRLIDEFEGESVVCSADHYFLNTIGVYNFDFNLLGKAHAACRDKFVRAVAGNIPLIIVDNCNIKYSDIKPYVVEASNAGYNIRLLESNAPWRDDVDECFKKNSHGVPLETISRMKESYQPNEHVANSTSKILGIKVEY